MVMVVAVLTSNAQVQQNSMERAKNFTLSKETYACITQRRRRRRRHRWQHEIFLHLTHVSKA